MKKLIHLSIISLIVLSGCSKEEESTTVAAEDAPPPPVVAQEVQEGTDEAAETASESSSSLMPTAKSVQESIPDLKEMEKLVKAKADEETQKAAEEDASKVDVVVDAENVEVAVKEDAATSGDDLMSKTMGTASQLAGSIDWQNLSWDKVSEVPYDNKEQLAVWATSQVDKWKGKLADSAKTQGLSMLSNLGDSGWQGALKDVVDAIQGVRESNPETWQLARGALVSSWETFQTKATEYLGN